MINEGCWKLINSTSYNQNCGGQEKAENYASECS